MYTSKYLKNLECVMCNGTPYLYEISSVMCHDTPYLYEISRVMCYSTPYLYEIYSVMCHGTTYLYEISSIMCHGTPYLYEISSVMCQKYSITPWRTTCTHVWSTILWVLAKRVTEKNTQIFIIYLHNNIYVDIMWQYCFWIESPKKNNINHQK